MAEETIFNKQFRLQAAKCESGFVDIHANKNYTLHSDLLLYAVISAVLFCTAKTKDKSAILQSRGSLHIVLRGIHETSISHLFAPSLLLAFYLVSK